MSASSCLHGEMPGPLEKKGKGQRKGVEPLRGETLQGKTPRRMGGEWEQKKKKPVGERN